MQALAAHLVLASRKAFMIFQGYANQAGALMTSALVLAASRQRQSVRQGARVLHCCHCWKHAAWGRSAAWRSWRAL